MNINYDKLFEGIDWEIPDGSRGSVVTGYKHPYKIEASRFGTLVVWRFGIEVYRTVDFALWETVNKIAEEAEAEKKARQAAAFIQEYGVQ